MGLYKLPQKRNDGIEYLDLRSNLYYSKYRYRARVYIDGITATWWAENESDIDDIIKRRRWNHVDRDLVLKYLNWYRALPPKKDKYCIRLEHNTGAIFSNDLDFLKTVETIGAKVDYTEVDTNAPTGTKYFKNDPKHQYRVYLKSKRVKDTFVKELKSFIDRYKGTDTVITPSPSLDNWLNRAGQSKYQWMNSYCSGHYFIDYNDESTLTLFMLMFDGMVAKRYKLEKRPD